MTTKENTYILIYDAFLPFAFMIEKILFTNNFFNTIRKTDINKISVMISESCPEIIIVANKMGERKDLDLLHLLNRCDVKVPVIIFNLNKDYNSELNSVYKNLFCIKLDVNLESLIEVIQLIVSSNSSEKRKDSNPD
ncbi:MAG: hypothetical protein IPO63_03060 [Bacteroidetes bacterium]|nr:hypothetical protein [Bacteroidota bacterium]